jgi:lysophospholipase L1-like esterase
MRRRSRLLAVAVALVLTALGTATPAAGQQPPLATAAAAAERPPLPDSIAAIGDSITRAVDAGWFYGSWPAHSWSTGYASGDGIASHYERIRARNPAIRGRLYNNAVSGARMEHAPAQARRAVAQGAEYVTILIGANDLCRDGTLTRPVSFRRQFRKTLGILRTGLPDSHVFVASIPNLHQLWWVLRRDPAAQFIWHAAGICPSMLHVFNSPADRWAVIKRQRQLNQVLEEVCATWSRCRFDNYLVYNYDFTRDLVSRLDYFHPNLKGQATLAALTWRASWWGS